MALRNTRSPLIERLPNVRGRIATDFDMSKITWFRVGGPAEVLFKPADADDLATFLAGRPYDVPVTIIGVASNLLVRDGGIPGVVIRLGKEFAATTLKGSDIEAGAGAMDINVARFAQSKGIEGLEFLYGIPGTVGGALRMNAGAYGVEMKDIFIEGRALDANGGRQTLSPADMGFTYRGSALPEGWIMLSARLRGRLGKADDIARRMDAIHTQRDATQPTRIATGGSTFKNPVGHKAWELIEKAGCRGLRHGGAMVSEKHCNFLINTGDATASDIESLGEDVRARVKEATGVELEWEIRRIGEPAPQSERRTS